MDQPTGEKWARREWWHGAAWGVFSASMGAMVMFGAHRGMAWAAMAAALAVAVVTQPDRHPADGPTQSSGEASRAHALPVNRPRAAR